MGRLRHVRLRPVAVLAAFTVIACLTTTDAGAFQHHRAGPPPVHAATAPTRLVRVGDIDLAYRSIGRGRPLVLIIGYRATMDEWDPGLLDALASNHRVIVFDNRGVGLSTTTGERLTIALMAEDTAGLIRALHLHRPDVLGWSMGGFIAQDLALTHRRLVRRLVLASTEPGGPHSIPADPAVIAEEQDPATTSLDLLHLVFPPDATADADAYVMRLLTRTPLTLTVSPQTLRAQTEAVNEWLAGPGAFERLGRIRQKTLVAAGSQDPSIPAGNAAILARRIPHARLVIYRGAGHAFLFQDSVDFRSRLRRFLGCRPARWCASGGPEPGHRVPPCA